MFSVGILTVSDKGSKGERTDESGKVIKESLAAAGGRPVKYDIIPDEADIISKTLKDWCDGGGLDVILTTGGTGLARRDVTPEATMSVVDRVVPGFAEAMRVKTLDITPMAMLSRATAGQRGNTLIINLPGNPKAVRECLQVILPAIPHAVEIMTGALTEHAPVNQQKK